MHRIGVVDTMFARFDMGAEVLDEFASIPGHGRRFEIVRRTVPGFKDLAVQAKRLIDEDACRIVVVLGMPGKEPVDKTCAHEASTGIMMAQLMTNTAILEVFVHEDESDDPEVVARICRERSRKHARNAYWMLYEPEQLVRRAGQGIRQGLDDAGPLVAGSEAEPGSSESGGVEGGPSTSGRPADDEIASRVPPMPAGKSFGAGSKTARPGPAIRSSTSYDGSVESAPAPADGGKILPPSRPAPAPAAAPDHAHVEATPPPPVRPPPVPPRPAVSRSGSNIPPRT